MPVTDEELDTRLFANAATPAGGTCWAFLNGSKRPQAPNERPRPPESNHY